MKLIVKQCIGCLIFLGGVGLTYLGSFSRFFQNWTLFELSTFNIRFLAGLLCLWLCVWNALFYILKHRKKDDEPLPSPAPTPVQPHSFVPRKMKIVTSAILSVNPNDPAVRAAAAQEPKDPVLEEDLKQLSNGWWGNLELSCFTHINYQNIKIDLTYTSDTCTIVVYILSQDGQWHVDPATGNFINETKVLTAPVAVLKQQLSVLHQVEEGAKIVPVILLMRGTIQEEEKVLAYLKQNGIEMARFNDDAVVQAPTLAEILEQNFAPAVTSIDTEDTWDELNEQEEQEMLRKKQEANYAQDEEDSEKHEGE